MTTFGKVEIEKQDLVELMQGLAPYRRLGLQNYDLPGNTTLFQFWFMEGYWEGLTLSDIRKVHKILSKWEPLVGG